MTKTDRFVRPSTRARALRAEPQLQAIETLVDALCGFVRPSDTFCSGCVWDTIIKPLASPLVGWERGYLPEQAKDPDPDRPRLRLYTVSELAELQGERPTPETATEAWLRTSEAWDAVTDSWLRRLEAADPGNGHGIHRHRRGAQ